jgi:hypothetical protein
MKSLRELDYVVSEHAMKRAWQRFKLSGKELLELWWSAKQDGHWSADKTSVTHCGMKFMLQPSVEIPGQWIVATIIPTENVVSPPPVVEKEKIVTYTLNSRGATKISIPQDTIIMGTDYEGENLVIVTRHAGGIKHERIILVLKTGDITENLNGQSKYLESIDGHHIFDLGFTKVDVN